MLDRSLGVYQYHLESEADNPSKRNNQNIERQPLTWRARMHRLACKTLCFSKSIHILDIILDIVIGLFDNCYVFVLPVSQPKHLAQEYYIFWTIIA